jgi:hypothetical protein
MTDEKEMGKGIYLIVRRSPISGSGIARVNISILQLPEFTEGKVVLVENEKNNRVLRIVGDSRMKKGEISLRQKDMNRLKVKEGDKVKLLPVKGMSDHLTKRFRFLQK